MTLEQVPSQHSPIFSAVSVSSVQPAWVCGPLLRMWLPRPCPLPSAGFLSPRWVLGCWPPLPSTQRATRCFLRTGHSHCHHTWAFWNLSLTSCQPLLEMVWAVFGNLPSQRAQGQGWQIRTQAQLPCGSLHHSSICEWSRPRASSGQIPGCSPTSCPGWLTVDTPDTLLILFPQALARP